jgi:hypothetical protein
MSGGRGGLEGPAGWLAAVNKINREPVETPGPAALSTLPPGE